MGLTRRTIGPGMNLPFAASGEGPYPNSGAVGWPLHSATAVPPSALDRILNDQNVNVVFAGAFWAARSGFHVSSLPRHSVAPRSHASVYQIFFSERRGPFGLGVGVCERHSDCVFFSAGRPIRLKLLLS